MKKVLVVVNYQNDFVSGAVSFVKAKQMERPLYNRVAEAVRDGYEIFFVLDLHDETYLSSREGRYLPVQHCLRGSDGAKLHSSMVDYATMPQAHIVTKTCFGAKDLPIVIKECCGKVDELELCGLVTNQDILSNAVVLQNHFKNATIKIAKDLCAAKEEILHEKTIDVLRSMHFEIV